MYLCILFIFRLWLRCTAYGILVPQPGIEPGSSAVKAQSYNHWIAKESPIIFLNMLFQRVILLRVKDEFCVMLL